MKKILALVLACMFALSALPAVAEETESKWVNILLMGGDARSLTRYERTDTMMILSVNYEEQLMKLTSVMRDTYVDYPTKSYSAKVNAANVYGGPELAVETISGIFDVDLEKYIIINMADLVAIIDVMGGVTVNVTEDERKLINMYTEGFLTSIHGYDGDIYLGETGDVHLNGMLATAYTRNRYSDSDFGRVMRQQEVLLNLGRQLQEMNLQEAMAMDLKTSLQEHINTNLTEDELKELAMLCLVVDIDQIGQYRIPADGTYYIKDDNIIAKLEENTALLHQFIYGTEN